MNTINFKARHVGPFSHSFKAEMAIGVVAKFLGVNIKFNDILTKCNTLNDDTDVEVPDSIEDVIPTLMELEAVAFVMKHGTEDDISIVTRAITLLVNEENLTDSVYDEVVGGLEVIEERTNTDIPEWITRYIYGVVKGSGEGFNNIGDNCLDYVLNEITENKLIAVSAIEVMIKDLNPSVDQNVLKNLLHFIVSTISDLDIDPPSTDEEVDEVDATKRRTVIRDGKRTVINRRKKKMTSSQRRKISRALKRAKAKKRVKPSTIRKMLKSRQKGKNLAR